MNMTPREFQGLWARAVAAGQAAGAAVTPTPMTVHGSDVLLNGVPISNKVWHEPEGMCGFAWVSFPGNTSFGRWAKKFAGAGSHYPSGLCHWVHDFNQSVARKEAYAEAFAKVLQDAGIDCHAGSRLD